MGVDLYFTFGELDPADVQNHTVLVVDVLRATSTMVEALANGARAIYPTTGTEEAIKLVSSLGRDHTLLCGERKGLKIEGYDLGNSPAEFTREKVEGKQLVMNTTNGTQALVAVAGAKRVVIGSFMNLSAVAKAVAGVEGLVVVCAGRGGRFSLDDAVCAGSILSRLGTEWAGHPDTSDAARVALDLARDTVVDASYLAATAGGRNLVDLGMEADLELCSMVDRHLLAPIMVDGTIRLPPRKGN
jgi:2-phosphosulfolactate phosphatase